MVSIDWKLNSTLDVVLEKNSKNFFWVHIGPKTSTLRNFWEKNDNFFNFQPKFHLLTVTVAAKEGHQRVWLEK